MVPLNQDQRTIWQSLMKDLDMPDLTKKLHLAHDVLRNPNDYEPRIYVNPSPELMRYVHDRMDKGKLRNHTMAVMNGLWLQGIRTKMTYNHKSIELIKDDIVLLLENNYESTAMEVNKMLEKHIQNETNFDREYYLKANTLLGKDIEAGRRGEGDNSKTDMVLY